ncbi:hypothetical protein Hamer_G027301, partial [Homarus americanus]
MKWGWPRIRCGWPLIGGDGLVCLVGGLICLVGGLLYVVGGLLYVVGGLLYAVGGLLYAVGGLLYAVGGLLYVVDGLLYVVGGPLLYVVGGLLYAVGGLLYAVGGLLYGGAGSLAIIWLMVMAVSACCSLFNTLRNFPIFGWETWSSPIMSTLSANVCILEVVYDRISFKQYFWALDVSIMGVVIYMANYFMSTNYNFGYTVTMPTFLTFIGYNTICQFSLLHIDVAIINKLRFTTFTLDELHDK